MEEDQRVEEKIRRMEEEARLELERKEAEEVREEKSARKRTIRRAVKKKILLYSALVIAFLLVWQKIHFLVIIPGSFLSLFLILGGIFLCIYLGLNYLFSEEP